MTSLTLFLNDDMGELLKFVSKILLGTTAAAAGAALIKNGMENARNIKSFTQNGQDDGNNFNGHAQR